jgi:hypothetical protein
LYSGIQFLYYSAPHKDVWDQDGELAHHPDPEHLYGADKARSDSGRPKSRMRSIWDFEVLNNKSWVLAHRTDLDLPSGADKAKLQRALDHLSSFFFSGPHDNLCKQAKLIEIKAFFLSVGLFERCTMQWPPSSSLQLQANGGHSSKTMHFDPTSHERSKKQAFSMGFLLLPWGPVKQ